MKARSCQTEIIPMTDWWDVDNNRLFYTLQTISLLLYIRNSVAAAANRQKQDRIKKYDYIKHNNTTA